MYKTNIKEGALHGLHNGVKQAVKTVRGTIGAAGKNVIIAIEQYPYSLITNDGSTIIEHTHFEDPLENMGLQLLKEVTSRSNKNSGDGSSTTCILVDALLEQGIKHNGIEVKKSLDACLPLIEESIKNQKKLITSDDYERLKQVATISGEDEKMGELLAEIYQKIGANGIVQPEYVLGKEKDTYDFIQGVRFANQCGLLSSAMVHDEEAIKENRNETRAVYENPIIIVTKTKIKNIREIDPLVRAAAKKDRDLVIFADDMDSQVASALIANHQTRKAGRLELPRITIVKAPTVWKDFVYEDFAVCTGATIISDQNGVNFKNIQDIHLGTCDKIIIEKDETILLGTKDLTGHIAELQKITDDGNDFHDDAARRIGWLTSKTVLMKVGGLSETEITYKRLKLEDAINATRSALTDGIVAGGGVSYLNVANDLIGDSIGVQILREALKAPIQQIMENAGVHEYTLILPDFGSTSGYDAKSNKIVDMFDAGIVDSAKVALNAMKNAIGIASTILTIDTGLILPPKEPMIQAMMPQFPFQG